MVPIRNCSLPGRGAGLHQLGESHFHAPLNDFNTNVLSAFICKALEMLLFRPLVCKSSFRDPLLSKLHSYWIQLIN